MELIDKPLVASITAMMKDLTDCDLRRAQVPSCGWLDEVAKCGFPFFCARELMERMQLSLIQHCGAEFFIQCREFGDIIAPLCPFDPVPFERVKDLDMRINALEARVERLLHG